jgi:hypothetical protein
MKKVLIEGKLYHVADNENEFRAAVKKRDKEKCRITGRTQKLEIHHIAGRTGILKYMVENGMTIHWWVHRKQKSTDITDVKSFNAMIYDAVDHDLLHDLQRIKNFGVKTLGMEEIE